MSMGLYLNVNITIFIKVLLITMKTLSTLSKFLFPSIMFCYLFPKCKKQTVEICKIYFQGVNDDKTKLMCVATEQGSSFGSW